MFKAVHIFLAFVLATALAFGCSTIKEGAKSTYEFVFDDPTTATPVFPEKGEPVVNIIYEMADTLNSEVNRALLPKESPVYVQRFTNMENPADNSPFGEVIANQLGIRLVQRGWRIAEGAPPENAVEMFDEKAAAHTDDDIMVRKEGYSLEPSVLKGAYEVSDDSIIVLAKVVRMRDNVVAAAHAWSLPVNERIRDLLNTPDTGESMQPTVKTTF
ncbi:FlgO family outer membrane protein [Salidesulfovibrio brasiliensis]|uniref:FlgO family outer membrane protein n=1 Tax=Salidesulfovibrio brasiliensis TaxID=221711 RepID=UPI0006CF7B70|nr:FlgO family outer membrane protein [Salidesulfovibrio brasiliensis]